MRYSLTYGRGGKQHTAEFTLPESIDQLPFGQYLQMLRLRDHAIDDMSAFLSSITGVGRHVFDQSSVSAVAGVLDHVMAYPIESQSAFDLLNTEPPDEINIGEHKIKLDKNPGANQFGAVSAVASMYQRDVMPLERTLADMQDRHKKATDDDNADELTARKHATAINEQVFALTIKRVESAALTFALFVEPLVNRASGGDGEFDAARAERFAADVVPLLPANVVVPVAGFFLAGVSHTSPTGSK